MWYDLKRVTFLFGAITSVVCYGVIFPIPARAQLTMDEVLVTAEELSSDKVLPDVQGTRIYSGKKTSVIDLQEAPTIMNSNYRQALQKTPGLLLSEETTPLLSLGYRGLPPDRVQYTQVLKDGIPIDADMVGYPEAYYTPPLDLVERIDFIRGGASLMYGPQPGGAINFVTKEPYSEGPFAMSLRQSGGSFGLYSNFTGISGTQGPLGYYGYFHHRQADGFRVRNSDYDVNYGGTKFKLQDGDNALWRAGFDIYSQENGEPGGLTRADFESDPDQTTRLNDHFELNRFAGSLGYENEIDDQNLVDLKFFGGYYERLSWRQRTAGSSFGTVPNGTTNDILSQEFYTKGTEARLRHLYEGFGADENTLTLGTLFYHVNAPRTDKRGASPNALDGDVRKDTDRQTNYLSFFLENLFHFGKLSVTPGVRLENIWQSITENQNLDKTTVPLVDDAQHDFVPLGGLGIAYAVMPEIDVYANISQGYRPKVFTQAVPVGAGQVVNDDLEEGKSWQADVGVRGNPLSHLFWDSSVFYMEFEDQIGTVGNTVDNVGDSRHYGVELAGELNLTGWFDSLKDSRYEDQYGGLNIFANAMLLNAEFVKGPNDGHTPQYAPDFVLRTGLEYNYQDKHKVRFAGTFTDDHFADDGNTENFAVPSYKVWDLTSDFTVYKDYVSLFAGINNIFGEEYYARVTSSGIDPAPERNYYAGVKLDW